MRPYYLSQKADEHGVSLRQIFLLNRGGTVIAAAYKNMCLRKKYLFSIRTNVTVKAHLHVYFEQLCSSSHNFEIFYMDMNFIAFCTIR